MPESISFNCPNCFIRLGVPADQAGISGPCPNCHTTISSPTTGTEPPAQQHSSAACPTSSEPLESTAPAGSGVITSEGNQDEIFTNATTEDSNQTSPALSLARQYSDYWRHSVKNLLIGFTSVIVLAVATWGIAKTIEKFKQPNSYQIVSPSERIAPEASLLNTHHSNTKRELIIIEDGKVVDGDTVFPITNTVEPVAINLSSIAGASLDPPVTLDSVIDRNHTKRTELLDDNAKPSSTEFVPQGENERAMVECRELINNFLAANTLEERLPLIFSERIPAAEMSETFADTLLNGPVEIAKTITNSPLIYFGYEGPNANGIAQQYFLLTLAPLEDEKKRRNITVHMANHLEGKYRINADAFLFSAENKLEQFVNNPEADPLTAYLFLERCHFSFDTDVKEPPSETFNVRLLSSPLDQSDTTAIVNAINKTGDVLDPVVKWGVPPRAAIVELKHEATPSGQSYISVDRVLKLNWLQSYEVTPNSDE